MNTKLENIACRPGTTDAMQRLADENEALRAERDELAARAGHQHYMLDIIRQIAKHPPVDRAILHRALEGLEADPAHRMAYIKAAGAREALERAMQPKNFSDTVVRVDLMRDIIEQMEVGE